MSLWFSHHSLSPLSPPLVNLFRSELPQEQYEPLRLELFRAILRFSSGPRLVLTRLCVAMVMYMFHAVPDMWPNAIMSSIQTLQSAQTSVSEAAFLFGLLPRSSHSLVMRRALTSGYDTVYKAAIAGK